jgi:hypothetical protein
VGCANDSAESDGGEMSRAVIEKDLFGAMLSPSLMSQIRAEVLGYANHGARVVDISLRGVSCVGGIFPEIIVDYGGDILQTYGRALNILLDHKKATKDERDRCYRIVEAYSGIISDQKTLDIMLREIRDGEPDEACR